MTAKAKSDPTHPDMFSHVTYVGSRGMSKPAQVVGTPDLTYGRIPDGQVMLLVTNPLTARQYGRRAQFSPDLGAWYDANRESAPEPYVPAQPADDGDQI